MFEFLGCQINVEPQRMSAIVRTESSANPFAIGIVGYYLSRQPSNELEALQVVKILKEKKINYSVGLAQVNQINFSTYNLDEKNMFKFCDNLKSGSQILKLCFDKYKDWDKAYSCYYSGNPITGFKDGYVAKVNNNFNKEILKSVSLLSGNNSPIKIIQIEKKEAIVGLKTNQSVASRRLNTNAIDNENLVQKPLVMRRLAQKN